MGLIVFRIFKTFREVEGITTPDEKSSGITRRRKLRSITFVIIESGMALFVIRVVYIAVSVFTCTEYSDLMRTAAAAGTLTAFAAGTLAAAAGALDLIGGILAMMSVIISSVIAIHFTDSVDLARE